MSASVPSKLFSYIYGFLTENKLKKTAKALRLETGSVSAHAGLPNFRTVVKFGLDFGNLQFVFLSIPFSITVDYC